MVFLIEVIPVCELLNKEKPRGESVLDSPLALFIFSGRDLLSHTYPI